MSLHKWAQQAETNIYNKNNFNLVSGWARLLTTAWYLTLHVCVGPRQPAKQKLETWNNSIFCYWPVPLSPPPRSDLQVYLCFQPEAARFKWHSHQISHSSKTLSPFWSNVSRCVSPYSLLANQILTSNSTGIFIYSKGTKHSKLGKIRNKDDPGTYFISI